jgi:hypothetical protein
MQRGWSRRDAEHLGVVELGLGLADQLDDDALRAIAEHVCTALQWEPVFCGAQSMFTATEHETAWRRLAVVARDDAVRELMHHLAALSSGHDVMSVSPDEAMTLISEDDLHLQEAARAAEAAGDFARAAELLRESVRPVEDAWLSDLEYLVSHGDEMSPARWGRWICSAAVRWCLANAAAGDLARQYAVVCLTALGADAELIRRETIPRAVQDQIVHDALLFDAGGLAAFVEARLDAGLARRVPRFEEWLDARPTVVRLDGRDDDGLARCQELTSGESVVVGDERLADDHPAGTCFYGRLVCVDGGDIRYFATMPTIVPAPVLDATVAALVQDAPAERRLHEMHRELPRIAPAAA